MGGERNKRTTKAGAQTHRGYDPFLCLYYAHQTTTQSDLPMGTGTRREVRCVTKRSKRMTADVSLIRKTYSVDVDEINKNKTNFCNHSSVSSLHTWHSCTSDFKLHVSITVKSLATICSTEYCTEI